MAHSTTEVQYHPMVYKTELCPRGTSCKHKILCPYAHSAAELRKVNAYQQFIPESNSDSNGEFEHQRESTDASLRLHSSPSDASAGNLNVPSATTTASSANSIISGSQDKNAPVSGKAKLPSQETINL